MLGELKKAVWVGMLVAGVSAAAMPAGAQEEATNRKITKRVTPVYPPLARKAQITGTVKLVLTVTPQGTVKSVRTIGGNALFVAAAESAVKQWTFEASNAESAETVAVQFSPVS